MSAELCTDQGDRIKTALESLKDFGPESVIFFRKDEVELVGKDHAKVVDIRLVLPADKIKETGGYYKYDCPDPQIELGIRTKVVATALKRFSPGDRVIIGARKGIQREFYISCKNKGKNFTSEIVAPMVSEMDQVAPNIGGMFKYNGSIIMNSATFHGIIGDLLTSEPTVITVDCDGKTLRLSGEGNFSKSSVEIGDSKVIADPDCKQQQNSAVFQKATGAWVVHESYATNHLQRIAKAKNMAPRITLSIAQNVPASFEYDTPIGKLTYIVCARAADDINDPKFKGPEDPVRKRRCFAVSEPIAEYDSEGDGALIAEAPTAEGEDEENGGGCYDAMDDY
jgi:hypothetical protein